MAFQFPLKALFNAVVSELETNDVGLSAGVRSFFGGKHVAGNHAPPRYVWVPVAGKLDSDIPTRGTSSNPEEDPEHRLIGCDEIIFEVGIWGRSHDEAWALRQNLLKAINDNAQADAGPMSDIWAKEQAHNQAGELVVTRLALRAPVEDVYVPIPSLESPTPETTIIDAVEGAIVVVENLESDEDPAPEIETSTD